MSKYTPHQQRQQKGLFLFSAFCVVVMSVDFSSRQLSPLQLVVAFVLIGIPLLAMIRIVYMWNSGQ
jgi:hypothetical protein